MFLLQKEPIDSNLAKNTYINHHNGALVSFEGLVRSDKHENKEVFSLLYIADEPVCLKEGESIMKEAISSFHLTSALCIQRIGEVQAGQTAIWIGAWSPHRDEAFKGCRFIIEETKKRLLIWKKENFTNGTSAWVRGPQTPVIYANSDPRQEGI